MNGSPRRGPDCLLLLFLDPSTSITPAALRAAGRPLTPTLAPAGAVDYYCAISAFTWSESSMLSGSVLRDFDASVGERVQQMPPREARWAVLVGFAAEHLIDRVLNVRRPNLVRLVQESVVLVRSSLSSGPRYLCQIAASGGNQAAVVEVRCERHRHSVRTLVRVARRLGVSDDPPHTWNLGLLLEPIPAPR